MSIEYFVKQFELVSYILVLCAPHNKVEINQPKV